METAAKLIYGAQAVVFTGGGIFFLYAAILGADDWFLFGIGEYVWFSLFWLSFGLLWWFVLLKEPDFMSGT